ncbi:hypothetical protein MMC22_002992 [Lobaria immixta]|nr:hypothetical protein [Lobaria immixta]
MAPARTKMNTSSSAHDNIEGLPSRQQTVTIQSPARTPPTSPRKKAVGITQGQKQALIDNLQLEVTERARKLRAQYALQAQSLRTRIELRINRIPKSLRSANMGELVAKHLEKKKEADSPRPLESEFSKPQSKQPQAERSLPIPDNTKPASTARLRGTKRKSDEMENADKENAISHVESLPNPKKRTKAAVGARTRQATNPSTVLSPKSSNSRTLPRSPTRPLGSPQKPYISHPASPLKPMPPFKSASPAKAATITATANLTNMTNDKVKPTRAKANTGRKATNPPVTVKPAATRTKCGIVNAPIESRSVSNSSNASNTSAGTTIMKKGGKLNTAVTTVASKKKNLNMGVRAAGKKIATTSVEAPPAERRVLRKRA